ncbi:TPA_asm: protein 3 [Allium angulosum virus 1]|uniref:protein 3 n=1 Tax=Allium angulosum virus 1 TaxID=2851934 RepID=UPI00205F52FA|nr:protein 3 [Allium angulosum virus 1]DAZ85334.1 TPA_asm: protein 3 [Allium angulosum virus 1]
MNNQMISDLHKLSREFYSFRHPHIGYLTDNYLIEADLKRRNSLNNILEILRSHRMNKLCYNCNVDPIVNPDIFSSEVVINMILEIKQGKYIQEFYVRPICGSCLINILSDPIPLLKYYETISKKTVYLP